MLPTNDNEERILIMGIGNYLMGDEGVGVHCARRLLELPLPPNVDVIDGGTGGFHLLEYFEKYPHIILVDATLDGQPPGTIRLIRPKFVTDFPQAMSTHDIGLKDMVGALQLLGKTPQVHLIVVSIATLQQQGIMLSPEIEDVMLHLYEVINDVIGEIEMAIWEE